jgi:hypothetical protein
MTQCLRLQNRERADVMLNIERVSVGKWLPDQHLCEL